MKKKTTTKKKVSNKHKKLESIVVNALASKIANQFAAFISFNENELDRNVNDPESLAWLGGVMDGFKILGVFCDTTEKAVHIVRNMMAKCLKPKKPITKKKSKK